MVVIKVARIARYANLNLNDTSLKTLFISAWSCFTNKLLHDQYLCIDENRK